MVVRYFTPSTFLVPDFIMFCTNFNDTFLSSEIIIFIEKNPCRTVYTVLATATVEHFGGRMRVVRKCVIRCL